MTDTIEDRLRDTSQNCFIAYEKWNANKKDAAMRGALLETIHELRRVAARLEIDVAVSDRDQGGRKPIQVPSHRDSKPAKKDEQGGDNKGQVEVQKKRTPRRKPKDDVA